MSDRDFAAEDPAGIHDAPVREVARDGTALIVRLAGEVDLYNAEVVRAALLDSAAEEPDRLVVDLSDLEFIDSTGLGVFIEARTRLPDRRAFLLAAPAFETRRALQVSGLDRHLPVHETVDDALGATL